MDPRDPAAISRLLFALREEHRDLDATIARLAADPSFDELALKRMKKRKLLLKDQIARLESLLIPDLDA
ncbi:MAG: YdcH family protein [Xanthomonadales bacterium]|nr:YdcH family protein [Xanthomonadales bacterium]